jgi:outer membrane protein assembly factor BamB
VFAETGLLKTWPAEGPPRLWKTEGLGASYASLSVVGDRLYTTGKVGDASYTFALDKSGKILWSRDTGPAHGGGGYPGSRSTPTVDGDTIYLMTSTGRALALKAASGEVAWEIDLLETFGAENIYFGISESPLVDGDRVIYTPGGPDAAVVALDKKTGATAWTSKGLSDASAYCNPVLLESGGNRQILTMVAKHVVGLDPESGAVLWTESMPAQYDIHATSPLVIGDKFYITHGYEQGGHMFQLAQDGRSVKKLWSEEKLDVHHGGAVSVDGTIYGAASKKTWYALDASNGAITGSAARLGKGSIVYADGRLYGYVEDGKVLLVDVNAEKLEVVSSFEVDEGDGNHWSHLVVAGGVLYVRHGDVLMAYDIAAQ